MIVIKGFYIAERKLCLETPLGKANFAGNLVENVEDYIGRKMR